MESSFVSGLSGREPNRESLFGTFKPGDKSAQSTEETVGTVTKGVLLITFLARQTPVKRVEAMTESVPGAIATGSPTGAA